jgi:hypothetical protein
VVATVVGFLLFLARSSIRSPRQGAEDGRDITSPLSMIVIGAILAAWIPGSSSDAGARLTSWSGWSSGPPPSAGLSNGRAGLAGAALRPARHILELPAPRAPPIVANVYEGDVDSGSSLVFISTLALRAHDPGRRRRS